MKKTDKYILKNLKHLILSYEYYYRDKLLALDRRKRFIGSTYVKQKYSYSNWIRNHKQFCAIIAEKLDDEPKYSKMFGLQNVVNLHLFYSPKTNYSFNWHTDTENVFLYVLKGKKIVQIKNKKHILTQGMGVHIPKGHIHRVFNSKETWALSFGML